MEKILINKKFSFPAGEMVIVNGIAKANPDKGEVNFYINSNGLLCLQWVNLTNNTSKNPIVCSKGNWEWKKLNTKKGRVYYLQSTLNKEERYIFWLQCSKEMDEILMTKTTNIVNSGDIDFIKEEIEENEEGPMTIDEVVNSEESQSKEKEISNIEFIKNFAKSIKKIKKKYPYLQNILTSRRIREFIGKLDKEKVEELCKLLPNNQQDVQGLYDNICSPQFQQALEQLSDALMSKNFSLVIVSLGLDKKIASRYANGIEAFIRCIIDKFQKKEDGKKK